MDEELDAKGRVEAYHGVCWIEDHCLSKDFVDFAGAQGPKGTVGSTREPQLLVLTNALKKPDLGGKGQCKTTTKQQLHAPS